MVSAVNGMFNKYTPSFYTGRTTALSTTATTASRVASTNLAATNMTATNMGATNTATTQNSKSKGIVAKTGRNLSEMVLAIKKTNVMNAQTKVQNIFQKLAQRA